MNKTDRLIILISLGVLLVSSLYSVTAIRRQNIKKENIMLERQEKESADTINIKIWRRYHEEQVGILHEILLELKVIKESRCK